MLGLIAAALGITRDDDAAHAALDASLGFGFRLLSAGQPLIDYHTTQNPKPGVVKKRKPATRREALAADEPETALSRRWLRQDALTLCAVWCRENAAYDLDQIAAAIRHPVFVLYAGRKANALGLPLVPTRISADSLAAVLASDPDLPGDLRSLMPAGGWGAEVAHDACESFHAGLDASRVVLRRDANPVRSRWQFADRVVNVGHIPSPSKA
jgi:CRISPR system Cascade subunit CasD